MFEVRNYSSASLEQTRGVGKKVRDILQTPACLYLRGDLGTGKTTLCQSIIAAFGVTETVTSPTYNLIHEYPFDGGLICHMDLYRIEDPSELEYLALSDLWGETSIFLIEWPDQGKGYLQQPTHEILIENLGGDRRNFQLTVF